MIIDRNSQARPSTPLGNALGRAMVSAAYVLDYAVPLAAIKAYRLIPARARTRLFGGPSASGSAITQLRAHRTGGWAIIRTIALSNHPPRPK